MKLNLFLAKYIRTLLLKVEKYLATTNLKFLWKCSIFYRTA